MDDRNDELTVGTAVQVPVGDGAIWRFGWIIEIDEAKIVVDLGRDGKVPVTRDQVRRL